MIRKIFKENLFYIVYIIIILILFLMIMKTNLYYCVLDFDNYIINILDKIVNNNYTAVFNFFTFLGNFYIPFVIIVCIFIFDKRKIKGYILSVSYAFSGVFSYISKLIISRPRPSVALINIPHTYSFPSGHTLNSIVFYMICAYLLSINCSTTKKYIILCLTFIFTLFISFSRLYLKVHYFSDILGGIIFGILLVLMLIKTINKYYRKCML